MKGKVKSNTNRKVNTKTCRHYHNRYDNNFDGNPRNSICSQLVGFQIKFTLLTQTQSKISCASVESHSLADIYVYCTSSCPTSYRFFMQFCALIGVLCFVYVGCGVCLGPVVNCMNVIVCVCGFSNWFENTLLVTVVTC